MSVMLSGRSWRVCGEPSLPGLTHRAHQERQHLWCGGVAVHQSMSLNASRIEVLVVPFLSLWHISVFVMLACGHFVGGVTLARSLSAEAGRYLTAKSLLWRAGRSSWSPELWSPMWARRGQEQEYLGGESANKPQNQ